MTPEQVREARLRLRDWDSEKSDCPICEKKFATCDHLPQEALAELRHNLEDARVQRQEQYRQEQKTKDALASFSMPIHFHDVRERMPFDDYEDDVKDHLIGDFLVIGVWYACEPSPPAEARIVGYNGSTGQWTWPTAHRKPWPFGHRVRYWAEVPRVRWDEMTDEQKADFMSAPENP